MLSNAPSVLLKLIFFLQLFKPENAFYIFNMSYPGYSSIFNNINVTKMYVLYSPFLQISLPELVGVAGIHKI